MQLIENIKNVPFLSPYVPFDNRSKETKNTVIHFSPISYLLWRRNRNGFSPPPRALIYSKRKLQLYMKQHTHTPLNHLERSKFF